MVHSGVRMGGVDRFFEMLNIGQSEALLGVAGLAYLQVEIPKYNDDIVLEVIIFTDVILHVPLSLENRQSYF